MKKYYEAHVTFNSTNEIYYPTWKFSRIDGDPILGKGIKMYLTKQFKETVTLQANQEEMSVVSQHVYFMGGQPLRTKIELVVYDTKIIPEELLQEPLN